VEGEEDEVTGNDVTMCGGRGMMSREMASREMTSLEMASSH